MTWAFIYVAALILGVLLWTVASVLGHEAASADVARSLAGRVRVRRGLGVALSVAGGVGLLAWWQSALPPAAVAAVTVGLGALAGLAAIAVGHRRERPAGAGRAVVVRGMAPGAYGQVRLESPGSSVLLAAHNVDTVELVAGSEVRVVGATRSVVLVRRGDGAG